MFGVSKRRARGLVSVVALMFAMAVAPVPAEAVSGGSAANPNEAPWAVHIRSFHFRGDANYDHCSGAIVGRGLVMTAGHCFQAGSEACNAPQTSFPFIVLQFANGRRLRINNPGGTGRQVRHPGYALCGAGKLPANDIGFIRFRTNVGLPALPLATPAEIDSFKNRGVTLFAGGLYHPRGHGWLYSRWIRKSKDGGLFMTPYCQYATDICFRSAGSAVQWGDSGGPFVGWLGGWKLLGPVSGYYGQSYSGSRLANVAASLADPGIRGWVDQQIAAGYP